ncbi:hypothetical protein ABBQ32_012091 [Trebouxia sp. C0010 RCD-2024]
MQKAIVSSPTVAIVPKRPARASVAVKASRSDNAVSQGMKLALIVPAVAAAMLMVGGPSEAKIFGKTGSSTESSQSGYDMTGTKHRGLKPGQRKELLAAAKENAQKAQQGIKKAVKE